RYRDRLLENKIQLDKRIDQLPKRTRNDIEMVCDLSRRLSLVRDQLKERESDSTEEQSRSMENMLSAVSRIIKDCCTAASTAGAESPSTFSGSAAAAGASAGADSAAGASEAAGSGACASS
ncbi:hypothetical protein TELCIR_21498, partial [Teladorsagia circumcincta]